MKQTKTLPINPTAIRTQKSTKSSKFFFCVTIEGTLHKQTLANNGKRSLDCGDIGIKSKSKEVSLVRLKKT